MHDSAYKLKRFVRLPMEAGSGPDSWFPVKSLQRLRELRGEREKQGGTHSKFRLTSGDRSGTVPAMLFWRSSL